MAPRTPPLAPSSVTACGGARPMSHANKINMYRFLSSRPRLTKEHSASQARFRTRVTSRMISTIFWSDSVRPPRVKLPSWKSCALEAAFRQDWLERDAAQAAIQSSTCGTDFANTSDSSLSYLQTTTPVAVLGFFEIASACRCSALVACSLIRDACKLPRIAYLDHLVNKRIFRGCDLGKSFNHCDATKHA